MAVVFGGVLLVSFALELAFSPAGEAIVRRIDQRRVTLTGAIELQDQAAVFRDRSMTYLLANPERVTSYLGRQVRISGILDDGTRTLRIEKIDFAAAQGVAASALDRSTGPQ